MYGVARFNSWIAATSFDTREDMIEGKDEAIDYFVKEYKLALEEHLKSLINTMGLFLCLKC